MTGSPAGQAPRKLWSIQALRGLAALAVVAYHAARHLGKAVDASAITRLTQPGHAGVDLFFVLSGFIILHVHRADIGRPQALRRYLWQRFARLMPIYWVALAATIALMLPRHADEVTAAGVALSASLLPTVQDPLLGVAWTLQHEMLFYGAFALLILNRRLGLCVLALWLGWGISQFCGLVPSGLDVPRLTSVFNLQFLFGMMAAAAVASGRLNHGRRLAALSALLLVVVGMLEATGRMDGYGSLARLAYGVPSALLIAGLAGWEGQAAKPVRVPGVLTALGDASYSLYLFHLLGIGVAWQLWLRTGLDPAENLAACYLFLLAGATACGLACHYCIEKPLLQYLRSRRSAGLARGQARDALDPAVSAPPPAR
nr:acyltransferase [uncultured Novosphingobium sp.]